MKSLFEQLGGTYTRQGDYCLPDVCLPPEEERLIGVYGQQRRAFLKAHHRVLYYNLLTSGKLNSYLADFDRQVEEMFPRLVKELAEKEGVTEAIKTENQMLWVQKMNDIRNAAMEIVSSELIYC